MRRRTAVASEEKHNSKFEDDDKDALRMAAPILELVPERRIAEDAAHDATVAMKTLLGFSLTCV